MSTAASRQQPGGAQQSSAVYELTLSCQKLTRVEGLERYRRLRVLDLSCNRLDRIQGISQNTELRELKLYSNNIAAELHGLERLTQLVHLFLQDNRITTLGPALCSLGKLQLLRLDSNCLSRVAPWEVEGCRELRLLDLSSNGLVEFSCGRALPELTSLNLAGNRLTHPPMDMQHCTKLEEVDLSGNPLMSCDNLKLLPCLRVLTLEDAGLESLQWLPPLRSLQQLHVARNTLSSVQPAAALFPLLEVLDVSDNRITEGEELQELGKLPRLKELFLKGNPLPYKNVEVRQLLPDLEVLDSSEGGKEPRPTTPTHQPVNYKQLQQEFDHSEEVFRRAHNGLSSKFSEVFSQLDDLDTAPHPPPFDPSPSSRPLSRCRSRIADAQSFAAQQL